MLFNNSIHSLRPYDFNYPKMDRSTRQRSAVVLGRHTSVGICPPVAHCRRGISTWHSYSFSSFPPNQSPFAVLWHVRPNCLLHQCVDFRDYSKFNQSNRYYVFRDSKFIKHYSRHTNISSYMASPSVIDLGALAQYASAIGMGGIMAAGLGYLIRRIESRGRVQKNISEAEILDRGKIMVEAMTFIKELQGRVRELVDELNTAKAEYRAALLECETQQDTLRGRVIILEAENSQLKAEMTILKNRVSRSNRRGEFDDS